MKKLFTLVTLIFFSSLLLGQTPFKDLDIKQFKYADAKNRTLDLALNQAIEHYNAKYYQHTQAANYFYFDVSFNSRQFKNTRKIQHMSALFGDFNFYKAKTKVSSRPWEIEGNFAYNTQSRFYRENKFLEFGPEIGISFEKGKYLKLNVAVSLKKGRGRIEPVSDVYMVRWMLKDMEDSGVNLAVWTQDDVFEVANRLNVINNYRIFDGRRQLKTQVKDISMAIESKGMSSLEPFDLFGIVFDNYTRAFIGNRFEGSRHAFVARPFFDNRDNGNEQIDISNGYGVELFGEYFRSRNTSLNSQHSLEFQSGVGFYSTDANKYKFLYPFLQGKYEYSWYPNSRTTLSWHAKAQFRYEENKLLNPYYITPSKSLIIGNVGLNTNYFVNFKTRVQANFSVSYNDSNSGYITSGSKESFIFVTFIKFLHSIY
ncbi:MAG TPA: hypothetical protein PLY70_10895 [Saprospiraceae bacterium]|nr:hypothetical protein [Saprospiraceae bacterium]HPN70644.1 hypothetical protein [Saprospiraceae bacterium]